MYANAKDWFSNFSLGNAFDRITNNPSDVNQVPKRGDIIIWNGNLAGSGGYGHIAIFDRVAGAGVFVSFDANWGGATCHFVSHNWGSVAGWLTPKATVTQGGDMPTTLETAKALAEAMAGRVPSDPANIADLQKNHVGKDPNAEIAGWYTSAERKAYISAYNQRLADLSTQVNNQNVAITTLQTEKGLSEAQKEQLAAQIATANSEIARLHDEIKDLQANPDTVVVTKQSIWDWFKNLPFIKKG
jgi:hypothetical protein